jgi:hypothetical protein
MLSFAAALLLTASTPMRLALPAWEVSGASAEQATAWAARVEQALRREGVEPVGPPDLRALLGPARAQELLSCADASRCLAQLATEVGCEAVLTGTVSQSESIEKVSLVLVAPDDGHTLAEEFIERRPDGAGFDEALEAAALRLLATLRPTDTGLLRRISGISLAATVALAAGATTTFIISADQYNRILTAPNEAAGVRLANTGKSNLTAAWVLTGLGLAALATSITTFVLGGRAPAATPTVMLVPGGAGIGLVGAWP